MWAQHAFEAISWRRIASMLGDSALRSNSDTVQKYTAE